MNEYSYEELVVGQEESFARTITVEMMNAFRCLSGDENPLHADEIFAKSKGFSSRVVYGMLSASLYSCLAGVHLPGKHCFLQSVHADFLNPVFIGDTLTVSGKITEKNDSVRQIVIRAVICNQDGEKVSRAKIEAGILP